MCTGIRWLQRWEAAKARLRAPSAFAGKVKEAVPHELQAALEPLLASIRVLSEQIKSCDRRIRALAAQQYPETRLLQQVQGVGPLVALTYVLTLEDPHRFPRSEERRVGREDRARR